MAGRAARPTSQAEVMMLTALVGNGDSCGRRSIDHGCAQDARVCTKKAPAGMHKKEVVPEIQAAKIKIFCFAWTPMRPFDELLVAEVRMNFLDCDGYTFFTDKGSTAWTSHNRDVIRVDVPEQTVKRSAPQWLYHRNMVGVLPCWTYLLYEVDLTPYHWVVHLELDHFVHPARLKMTIWQYIHLLKAGSEAEQKSTNEAMMLMFGNAFLFNRKMIREMYRQWDTLGKAADDTTEANGCPEFMRGGSEWPQHCSQDIVYPVMVDVMKPRVASHGRSGCGQFDATNGKGKPFPPGCWEMQKNPFGMTVGAELDAISEMAKVQKMGKLELREGYKGTEQEKNWELWWHSQGVPIIHHVSYPGVHKLARDMLKGPPGM